MSWWFGSSEVLTSSGLFLVKPNLMVSNSRMHWGLFLYGWIPFSQVLDILHLARIEILVTLDRLWSKRKLCSLGCKIWVPLQTWGGTRTTYSERGWESPMALIMLFVICFFYQEKKKVVSCNWL